MPAPRRAPGRVHADGAGLDSAPCARARPAVFLVARADGALDCWDYLADQAAPALTLQVALSTAAGFTPYSTLPTARMPAVLFGACMRAAPAGAAHVHRPGGAH